MGNLAGDSPQISTKLGTAYLDLGGNFYQVMDPGQEAYFTGTYSITAIAAATTPLPAALPMFAGGLGLVGYLARRRQRSSGQIEGDPRQRRRVAGERGDRIDGAGQVADLDVEVRIVNRAWRAMMSLKALLNPLRFGFFAFEIFSHKLLRWLGLPILILAALSATGALLLADRPIWALGLWGVAGTALLLARARIRPFSQLAEILWSISAIFVGLTDSWRGQTYQTWAPAKSRE